MVLAVQSSHVYKGGLRPVRGRDGRSLHGV